MAGLRFDAGDIPPEATGNAAKNLRNASVIRVPLKMLPPDADISPYSIAMYLIMPGEPPRPVRPAEFFDIEYDLGESPGE